MNTHQPPLKPVMDLLEHVRENRVLQISGEPQFSVQSALNILSGIDQEHTLDARAITRTEKIKQILGWSANPQYSVLSGIDEAALNWAHNEGYFDQPIHVHTAPQLPKYMPSVTGSDNTIVVHSAPNGSVSPANETCERLLMLYIQATHEQMKRQPVVLSGSGLSYNTEQQLNAWSFGFPSHCVDVASFVFRKNFAEVYASVVLLIGTQGSEDAKRSVELLIDRNANSHTQWNGEDDVWHHHLGNSTLRTVLTTWETLAQRPSSDIWVWVEQHNSSEFAAWLKQQPLAHIALEELIPTFDKRMIDLSYSDSSLKYIPNSSPAYKILHDTRLHLDSKLNAQATKGIFSKISRMLRQTSLTMGWTANDAALQHLSQQYHVARTQAFNQIITETTGTIFDPTLRSRLEHYRKSPTPQPYVLPPTP